MLFLLENVNTIKLHIFEHINESMRCILMFCCWFQKRAVLSRFLVEAVAAHASPRRGSAMGVMTAPMLQMSRTATPTFVTPASLPATIASVSWRVSSAMDTMTVGTAVMNQAVAEVLLQFFLYNSFKRLHCGFLV